MLSCKLYICVHACMGAHTCMTGVPEWQVLAGGNQRTIQECWFSLSPCVPVLRFSCQARWWVSLLQSLTSFSILVLWKMWAAKSVTSSNENFWFIKNLPTLCYCYESWFFYLSINLNLQLKNLMLLAVSLFLFKRQDVHCLVSMKLPYRRHSSASVYNILFERANVTMHQKIRNWVFVHQQNTHIHSYHFT